MKLTTYLTGTLAGMLTITGILFKIMHWEGASVMLTLGLGIGLIFLPLYAIYRYRKTE